MKKFAVILSGSGVYDGSEIHEATLTLLAINKAQCEYEIFAPNVEQHHVINHLTGEEMIESRNVLIESARIARGNIKDLKEFEAKNFDALLIPGGYGVAKNLSDYAFKGLNMHILPEMEKAITDTWMAQKPIGALCIAPVILAKIIKRNVELTIGNDESTANDVAALGAKHHETKAGEVTIDTKNRIFSTPCYMVQTSIAAIADSADNIVCEMLKTM